MILQLSQVALIAAIVTFAIYTFRLRTILLDRLIYLLLIGGGIAFVIHPPLSSWFAHLLGIGRGTDLVVYTFIIFSLFQMVSGASHRNTMEQQITALVRQCALLEPLRGPGAPSAPPADHEAAPVRSEQASARAL